MRINLNRIRIRNFLLFGNNTQEIDLKSGLNVIVGKFPGRTSSNKAGKSSFADAISFALYGKVLKNLKQNQLVNWRNKKNCVIEIDITKGKDNYTIKRGLKPNFIEVIKNGYPMPFVDKREIQKQIEDNIFNMSFNTFNNLIYTNINYSVSVLKMPAGQKRLFMENLFNLETFTKLSAACVNKLNAIDKKIVNLNNEIKVNGAVIIEHNKHIIELSTDNNKELIKRLEQINKEIDALEVTDVDNIKSNLTKETKLLAKTNRIFNAISSKLEIYKVKEKHLREISDNYGSIEGNYTTIKRSIKDAKALIKSHDTIDEIEAKIVSVREGRNKLQERLTTTTSNIISTTSMRDVKSADLDILRRDSFCPLCRRNLDDYMVFVVIEKDIEGYNEELKQCVVKERLVMAQIKEQNTKIELLKASSVMVKDLHTNLELLQGQLKTIESVRTKKVSNIGNKIIGYYRVNDIFFKLKEKYKNMIDKHKEQIANYTELLKGYDRSNELLEEKRKIEYHLDYNNGQQEIINAKIVEIEFDIKKLNEKNISIKAETDRLYKLMDYMAFIKDICKDDKIKQHAISSIIPYLNKKVNEYLTSIGYNFYVMIDKWIDCTIRGPGIHDGSYAGLSGGESRSVDIALMMAFHSIARLSSPNYFDIMVLDELLDSSIDSSTIGSIVDIIKSKQQEDNLKMFIVTHRQEISDIDFDHVYEVCRESGYSRVSVR